ncbi:MAG: DUF3105 domain-containing protein, partial [Actinobacteria bacterium]|nr:DUF3105 domain-containing protein [Actinomycetota bacterium]
MPHPNSKRAKLEKQRRAAERRQGAAGDRQERAERHVATEERLSRTRSRKRRSSRIWSLAIGAAAVLLIGGVGYLVWNEVRPGPELAGVERPNNDGRGHSIDTSYASAAPTSGVHASAAPSCGIYQTPLELSLAVHALEHGTVVLWYDATRPELGNDLAFIATGWDSHVIVSPGVDLDAPVVATAWNRLKRYDTVDPEIDEFIDTYRRRGPEDVAC